MTKTKEILIVMVSIIIIAALITTGIFFQYKLVHEQRDIATLSARRDDLMVQQEKIQAILTSLNSTLEKKIEEQNDLSAELATLRKERDELITQQQLIESTPPPQPEPVQVITPTRVTRAS